MNKKHLLYAPGIIFMVLGTLATALPAIRENSTKKEERTVKMANIGTIARGQTKVLTFVTTQTTTEELFPDQNSWFVIGGANKLNGEETDPSGWKLTWEPFTKENVPDTIQVTVRCATYAQLGNNVLKIRSTNGVAGNYKNKSDTVTVVATLPAPSAPTDVTVTPGKKQNSLSWSSGSDADTHKLFRGDSPGVYDPVPIWSGAGLSYVDTGLDDGKTYYYAVKANNISGDSAYSTEVSGLTYPPTPSGLSLTSGIEQIKADWNSAQSATLYKLYMGDESGVYDPTPIYTGPLLTYTKTGLESGVTKHFAIESVNASGASDKSSNVSGAPFQVPTAPTGLVATPLNMAVRLNWNPVAIATSYNVKMADTEEGPFEFVANTSSMQYIVEGLQNNVEKWFTVSALN